MPGLVPLRCRSGGGVLPGFGKVPEQLRRAGPSRKASPAVTRRLGSAYRSDKSLNANSPDLGGSHLGRDWGSRGP